MQGKPRSAGNIPENLLVMHEIKLYSGFESVESSSK